MSFSNEQNWKVPFKGYGLALYRDGVITEHKIISISKTALYLNPIGAEKFHFIFNLPRLPLFREMGDNSMRWLEFNGPEHETIRLDLSPTQNGQVQIDKCNSINSLENHIHLFRDNLLYLKMLIDTENSDESSLEKIHLTSKFLGYREDLSFDELNKTLKKHYEFLR